MAFMDFLLGKGEKTQQFQRFTPEQKATLDQLLGGVKSQLPAGQDFLSSLLGQSPAAMQAFEAPAMRQFQEDIIPSIAERFTGMDAQKSSAFGQQLGKAGAGLSENLSAQRAQLGTQGLSQLMQLLSLASQPQFENVLRPSQPGFLQRGTEQLGSLLPLLLLGL